MTNLHSSFWTPIFKRNRLFLGVGIILGGILLGLWRPYTPIPAPPENFESIAGQPIQLSSLFGKPVLITFWATDCPACVREIPHLIDLYQQYHIKGLEIIAVAMYYDIPSHVVEMTRMKQIPYPVTLDVSAQHAKAFGQVMLTPTTFLIDSKGIIVDKFIGKLPNSIATQIEQLL